MQPHLNSRSGGWGNHILQHTRENTGRHGAWRMTAPERYGRQTNKIWKEHNNINPSQEQKTLEDNSTISPLLEEKKSIQNSTPGLKTFQEEH